MAELLKSEWVRLLYIAIGMAIVLKLIFFNDSFAGIWRITLALLWIAVIPGYCMTLWLNMRYQLALRLIVGSMASAAIVGIASYYIGIMGIDIWYHPFLIPPGIIAVSVLLYARKKDNASVKDAERG